MTGWTCPQTRSDAPRRANGSNPDDYATRANWQPYGSLSQITADNGEQSRVQAHFGSDKAP
jgi:hypothetical protein